jgi:hypothetical protein
MHERKLTLAFKELRIFKYTADTYTGNVRQGRYRGDHNPAGGKVNEEA